MVAIAFPLMQHQRESQTLWSQKVYNSKNTSTSASGEFLIQPQLQNTNMMKIRFIKGDWLPQTIKQPSKDFFFNEYNKHILKVSII